MGFSPCRSWRVKMIMMSPDIPNVRFCPVQEYVLVGIVNPHPKCDNTY